MVWSPLRWHVFFQLSKIPQRMATKQNMQVRPFKIELGEAKASPLHLRE
jgi:hypothetical protein